MKLTKMMVAVAAVTAATATLAACGGGGGSGGGSSDQPQTGGDLVMAREGEPTSLVPSVPTDNLAIWIIEELYDTLTVPTQDGKTVKPSLATSWKQSKDKLSWTFHLRKDAKFTDGKPVTSADVAFSIKQNQKASSPFAFIDTIVTKMDTPDANTIVFHTKKPWAPLPADMALYANSVVPKDYAGMSQDEFAKKPVGSGPFKFVSWTKGSSLKIAKNPGYWKQGAPKLDSVTFTDVPDSNTRATQLTSGQIQINEYPPYSSIASLQKQSNVKVSTFPSSEVDYLGMNTTHKPFGDVNVRKAISHAVDQNAMLKAVQYGHGQIAGAYLSPVTWAHNGTIQPPKYDIAMAKSFMAKSSVPNGFSTTLLIPSGSEDDKSKAQLVQSSLGKIGIKVQIKTLDPSAQYSAKQAGNYDMAFGLYTTDIVDPDEIARFAGTQTGGAHAVYTWFKSPQMDKLAATASGETEQSKRKAAYDQMQQIVAEQVPFIPLFYVPGVYSYSSKVHGFHPGGTGNYFLENVWLSK